MVQSVLYEILPFLISPIRLQEGPQSLTSYLETSTTLSKDRLLTTFVVVLWTWTMSSSRFFEEPYLRKAFPLSQINPTQVKFSKWALVRWDLNYSISRRLNLRLLLKSKSLQQRLSKSYFQTALRYTFKHEI